MCWLPVTGKLNRWEQRPKRFRDGNDNFNVIRLYTLLFSARPDESFRRAQDFWHAEGQGSQRKKCKEFASCEFK
jgi:hypothetical protein